MRAHVDVETTVSVVAKIRPTRHVSLRIGPVFLSLSETEAVDLAGLIVNAVEELRAAYPHRSRRHP